MVIDKQYILKYLEKEKEHFSQKFGIKRIGLFGSFSKGTQTSDSDIDLVYEMKAGNQLGYFKFVDLTDLLENTFNRKVELVNIKYINPLVFLKAEKDITYV